VSVCVHALPSLQAEPLGFAGFEHTPVAVSQVPATWHWSRAEQITGLVPTQDPDWHASLCVQAFPSVQPVPSAAFGLEQMPVAVSQVPATWH
jgi:hypothetical protein